MSNNFEAMTPLRPYLLRGYHEWISDNNLTPHIVVDATSPTVRVPREYVEDDRITLNVSRDAIKNLNMRGGRIEFDASFSGEVFHVYTPISAVLAIYARENGRGIVFAEDDYSGIEDEFADLNDIDEDDGDDSPPSGNGKKSGKPKLRIVK